jgi:hypothetical protein
MSTPEGALGHRTLFLRSLQDWQRNPFTFIDGHKRERKNTHESPRAGLIIQELA